jgi:hypothetical protein
MESQEVRKNIGTKISAEYVFLNSYYDVGTKKEGVKLIINYQDKTYKIVPAEKDHQAFISNVHIFETHSVVPVRVPKEEFVIYGSEISKHKAIAQSIMDALEFVQKELKL